ncbi:MAG TPA: two-component regulator propeller domain-containing protein [Acidobacteriaceae bacterium]|nr:two-component regulator propeller domain-containing protein [Acidobacteriaceae bacterium]
MNRANLMGIHASGRWVGACGVLLLVLTSCAFGLDPNRTIDQFFHTAWTIGDGAPSGITEIVQTSDGFLWLGTQTGLIRFDGIRFEHYEPLHGELPSSTVTSLLATPDGGLWIGFVPHGVAFLKKGSVTTYEPRDGLPLASVYALGRDPEGGIWAGTTRGVFRFHGRRWQAAAEDWGLPRVAAEHFFLDRQARFWISTLDGLFFLPPHERRFRRFSSLPARLAESRAGTLWIAGGRQIRGLPATATISADSLQAKQIPLMANGLLVDRDDTLWIQTREKGIARISAPDALPSRRIEDSDSVIQRFGQEQGLSDDRVTDAFEDREGNIWVATRGGLDRFRPANLVPGPFPYGSGGQDLALVPAPDGSIWAGSLGQPLMRFSRDGLSFLGESRNVTCAWRDTDGSLWFGEDSGLLHVVRGKFENIALPSSINLRLRWGVQSTARDAAGGLWISVSENGVFRLKDGRWIQWGGVADLPRRTAVILWADPGGRLWFGYTVNEVAVLDGARVHRWSAAEGLNIGTVAAFGGTGSHLWVGGERGLAGFDGSRFHMLLTTIPRGFRGVSGIVELSGGDLWINEADGVAHIAGDEMRRWLRDPKHEVKGELFDFRDGSPGSASPIRPLPSEVLTRDGKIWVSGTSGTAWIDPAHIERNPYPPPVAIESIDVDDHDYRPGAPVTLPVLPSDIEIQYTALSLSIPARVRFRYQLEGYDKTWQDAEDRRSAFYTGLGPGHYTFRVIACNNDGVWNETGAAAELIVPPAWFQTDWFRVLCVLTAAFVLWLFYLLRLRQLALQMQGRLRERLAERERIARELHDTLLQGIQALVLRFQAASNRIAPGHPARQAMEEALNSADQIMNEGRRRVTDLRATVESPRALLQALQAAGDELARDRPSTNFRLIVHGTPRELQPLVYEETYWIGREALLNAFYHANARSIRAELYYSGRELLFRIGDDGQGMGAQILKDGGTPGHWGLRGMRERAEKIRGRLQVNSQAGTGTEVILRIPSAAAYRFGSRRWFGFLARGNRPPR